MTFYHPRKGIVCDVIEIYCMHFANAVGAPLAAPAGILPFRAIAAQAHSAPHFSHPALLKPLMI